MVVALLGLIKIERSVVCRERDALGAGYLCAKGVSKREELNDYELSNSNHCELALTLPWFQ